MTSFGRCLVRLLCVLFLASTGWAQTDFKTVVVFGDSLSDTGNIAHLTQTQFGVRYPADNTVLGFDYTDGRFTDGADTQPAAQAYFGVWVEQLAASFPSKPAIKDSLDGGTNYAYGDATTADGTTTESKTFALVPISITLNNMGQQVADYLATSPTPNAQTLYVLWGGANDLYNASDAGGDPIAAAGVAVQNEINLVQTLIAAGATNFLIPNLPPLGGVPSYAGGSAATAAALNTASGAFAAELAAGLSSVKLAAAARGITITVYQPDILTLFATVAGDPMAVGLGTIGADAQNISASPDTYLIWDGVHPTTTGHHFAAATARNLITPLVASSSSLSIAPVLLAGQGATVTATVTSTASKAVPSGLVTLFQGTTVAGSAALDGTGTATITLPGTSIAAGTYAYVGVFAGDTTYLPSASAVQPVTVLSTAVGTTTALSSSNLNADLNASVTFTATVAPTVSTYGPASGTVTFYDGTTSLGTGTLSNGVATYTTTSLTAGTHSVTATYGGSGIFGGSSSTAISEVVTAPSFTPVASPATLTIKDGASGTTMLSATSVGGFSGPLTLACGTLPAHLSCSFSSTTYTVPDPQTTTTGSPVTLTIATNAATALLLPVRPGAWTAPQVLSAAMVGPGLAGLLLLGLRRRRIGGALALTVLVVLLTMGAALGLSGCGSNNNAKAGTYTVPVTFTPSSGSAQTLNLTVTVQ